MEIADALLEDGAEEGVAVATGLKQARLFFNEREKKDTGEDNWE